MRTVVKSKSMRMMAFGLVALGAVVFTGCKDDDPEVTPAALVEDGYYIQGDASAFSGFDLDGSLQTTRNEVTQEDRATLKEAYMALQGGTSGFNIVEVSGSDRITWGVGTVEDVQGGTDDQPDVVFQRGTIVDGGAAFNVPSDGLYHVVIDTEVMKFLIVPVPHWGLIGGATPGGWGEDQILESQGFDFNTMTFTKSDIAMNLGDYKFRYGSGWKVELDADYAGVDSEGNDFTGIKVNANYGNAVDDLVPGGDNITNSESGFYTATVTWTAADGYSASMVKTGDIPLIDWTNIQLGLTGDGITIDGDPHNWNENEQAHTTPPTVSGTVYTYNFGTVNVNGDNGGFKIRGNTWADSPMGYNDVTVTGTAAPEFFGTDGDGNFQLIVGGMSSYDMMLIIDAETDSREFVIDY